MGFATGGKLLSGAVNLASDQPASGRALGAGSAADATEHSIQREPRRRRGWNSPKAAICLDDAVNLNGSSVQQYNFYVDAGRETACVYSVVGTLWP